MNNFNVIFSEDGDKSHSYTVQNRTESINNGLVWWIWLTPTNPNECHAKWLFLVNISSRTKFTWNVPVFVGKCFVGAISIADERMRW